MKYSNQTRILVAVDCIIFGFDGKEYNLLLIQRGFAPEKEQWSLMGGFVQRDESLNEAAERILMELTGLREVYMEQLKAFSKPDRDPIERVIAVTYVALIDINKYQKQLNDKYQAKWFGMNSLPKLIFDHQEMVDYALQELRYKAAAHPILLKLLPKKFTLPQLLNLYEGLFDRKIDKRNFFKKILSSKIIEKQGEKDKSSSKKGAYFYSINEPEFTQNLQNPISWVPKSDTNTNVSVGEKI